MVSPFKCVQSKVKTPQKTREARKGLWAFPMDTLLIQVSTGVQESLAQWLIQHYLGVFKKRKQNSLKDWTIQKPFNCRVYGNIVYLDIP